MPSSGPSGTVFAVTASPGTTGTTSAPPGPSTPIRQAAGMVVPVALVRGADRHHQPVAGLDRCDDARQRDRDPGGRAVGGDGHPHRRDGAAEQRPRAVRGDLVDLAEQHGLVRPRLLYILARHSGDREADPRCAGHEQRGVDGRGAEHGRLPGQLGGERGDPVAEVAQGAPEPRQGSDRGRAAARRDQRDLRAAVQRERLRGHRRSPGEPRVPRRLDGAARRRVAARTHAAGDRVAEARARVVAIAGEPVVEPLTDRVAHPLVRRAAVVAASVPEHPDGAAGRGDLPGVGVGLVEPEQGVRLPLDDQRRR